MYIGNYEEVDFARTLKDTEERTSTIWRLQIVCANYVVYCLPWECTKRVMLLKCLEAFAATEFNIIFSGRQLPFSSSSGCYSSPLKKRE